MSRETRAEQLKVQGYLTFLVSIFVHYKLLTYHRIYNL